MEVNQRASQYNYYPLYNTDTLMSAKTKDKCITPRGLVISYGIIKLNDHRFRYGLAPAQYKAIT